MGAPILRSDYTLVSPENFLLNADSWVLSQVKEPEPLEMGLLKTYVGWRCSPGNSNGIKG